jgi:hypothetical protein
MLLFMAALVHNIRAAPVPSKEELKVLPSSLVHYLGIIKKRCTSARTERLCGIHRRMSYPVCQELDYLVYREVFDPLPEVTMSPWYGVFTMMEAVWIGSLPGTFDESCHSNVPLHQQSGCCVCHLRRVLSQPVFVEALVIAAEIRGVEVFKKAMAEAWKRTRYYTMDQEKDGLLKSLGRLRKEAGILQVKYLEENGVSTTNTQGGS